MNPSHSMAMQATSVSADFSRKKPISSGLILGTNNNWTKLLSYWKRDETILDSLNHFLSIVLFSTINVFTDNKNLTLTPDLSKRVVYWKLKLEEFD